VVKPLHRKHANTSTWYDLISAAPSGLPVTGHFDAATFRAMGMETLTQ